MFLVGGLFFIMGLYNTTYRLITKRRRIMRGYIYVGIRISTACEGQNYADLVFMEVFFFYKTASAQFHLFENRYR